MKWIHTFAIALSLTLLGTPSVVAQTGHDLFQQALVKERSDGDLRGAIAVYERIAQEFTADRALTAKALVQMGRCYEKLGSTEAAKAYDRVLRDYADQEEMVAQARARLAVLQRAEAAPQSRFRKIEIASKPQNGVLSPDGNRLAFVSQGEVWVVPLHGNVDPGIAGEPARIADLAGAWDLTNVLAWSGDGNWIAVNSSPESWKETAVQVVPVTGGEARTVMVLPRTQSPHDYRLGLSSDGETLAFAAVNPDSIELPSVGRGRHPATAVYLASIHGGDARQLTAPQSSMPAFSPNGGHIAYVGFRERDDWSGEATERRFDSDLWVVPDSGGTPTRLASVSGTLTGPVWSPDGKYIAIHQQPGWNPGEAEIWVYPLSPDRSDAGEPVKIALPGLSRSLLSGWTPEGELGVFLQSERHQAIYTVPASGGKAVQVTPDGVVYYPRWLADGERIFFRWVLPEDEHPVRIAYVDAEGSDLVEVPWSGRSLMSSVPGGGHNLAPDGESIVVAASPEPYTLGGEWLDVWTIPLDGGPPNRLTNDESYERYPCWSPNGEWVAFTDWIETSEDEGFTAIFRAPAEGGAINQITSEADSVGPGAIAFSPDGKRIAFFAGNVIMTIAVDGGQAEVLVKDVKPGRHTQLEWSPDGSRIAHNSGGKIWITNLEGGGREALRTGLSEDAWLSEFGWSPDGKKIVFMASIGGDLEFWLMSDFLP